MEKTYIYRKHLREPAKFFLTILISITIVYSISSIVAVSNFKNVDKPFMAFVIICTGIGIIAFISLELLLVYFLMYKRFKKINLTLTDDGIIYNNAKGEIRIPYEDIKALKFPSIKYAGGWVKIIHTNGNIRLTVVLENAGDMVKTLKNKLDERNMSATYKEKAMYNFFKTSKYSDHSWERLYENIITFIIIIVINLGIGAISTVFITEIPIKIIIITGSLVGTFIPYLLSEIITGRRLAKGASKEDFSIPERDKAFEKKLYMWLYAIYAVLYFIVLIMVII